MLMNSEYHVHCLLRFSKYPALSTAGGSRCRRNLDFARGSLAFLSTSREMNAGDFLFVCFWMVPLHGVSWVMLFPLAPAMSRPLMMKVLYCFSPSLGKLSLPSSLPSPPNQVPAKQAAVNRDSQQDEFEVLQALWNRIHKNSVERVTGEGSGPSE